MSEWQDISTAPLNGTDVVLFRVNRNGQPLPPIVAGFFDNGEECGWSSYDDGSDWVQGEPTHWFPLPPPPALDQAQEFEQ